MCLLLIWIAMRIENVEKKNSKFWNLANEMIYRVKHVIKTLLRSYCTHFKSSVEVHWQSKRDCMDAIINLPFLWNAHHQKLVCLSRTHRDKHLLSHFLNAVCRPVLHQPVDHWIWDNLLFSRINNIALKQKQISQSQRPHLPESVTSRSPSKTAGTSFS